MTRRMDIYGDLHGPKRLCGGRDALVSTIRSFDPAASLEGSTGDKGTVWANGRCIGSFWNSPKGYWVRLSHEIPDDH